MDVMKIRWLLERWPYDDNHTVLPYNYDLIKATIK
jgi:hypothetical protein